MTTIKEKIPTPLITMDKLVVNMNINDLPDFKNLVNSGMDLKDRIILKYDFNPLSSHFNNKLEVFLDGGYVGYFRYNKRTVEHKRVIQFYFDKRVLYVKDGHWHSVVNFIMEELRMSYNGIHSIEVALDGPGMLSRLNKWYAQSSIVGGNNYKPFGKQSIVPFSLSRNRIDSFYMGSRKPKEKCGGRSYPVVKEVKVYNKLKEVVAKGDDFIVEYFVLNGLQIANGVDRCELFLKGRLLKGAISNLAMLKDQNVLYSIFKKFARPYLKWYDLNSFIWLNGNKNYKVLELIDFDSLPKDILHLDKLPARPQSSLKMQKSMVKEMYRLYVITGKKVYADMIYELIKEDKALEYWLFDNHKHFYQSFNFPSSEETLKRVSSFSIQIYKIKHGLNNVKFNLNPNAKPHWC